jgi:hypothetical protein
VKRGVTVGVNVYKAGFNVGGGKGFKLLLGLRNIRTKYDETQNRATNIKIVKKFHTRARDFFFCGGPFTSETS